MSSNRAKSITKKSKSSFLSSFRFLSEEKRKAIYGVYAWCRYTDDIADEDKPVELKKENLRQWSIELEKVFDGAPSHPVAVNLKNIIQNFPIEKKLFEEMIDAMWMDVEETRFDTMDDLYRYCYGVASTVGLMSIEIFGYTNEQSKEYAKELGIALQMTNIIRDVKKDALNGRVYLPAELLREYEIPESALGEPQISESLRNLLKEFGEITEKHYKKAEQLLPESDRGNFLPAIIMGNVYKRLFEKIKKRDYDVFSREIRLTPLEKSWIAVKTWLKEAIK